MGRELTPRFIPRDLEEARVRAESTSELTAHFRVFFSVSTNVTVARGDLSQQQGSEEDEDPLPMSALSQELLHEERRHGPLQV